ncbi:hypothetical protein WEI85_07760 [Actinomycetes bacterium KLBMP 9797]
MNPVAGDRPETWPGVRHSTAGIGQAWLHLPTGAAGLIGIRPHHDNGPIADRSTRLLESATPSPLPVGHPYAQRTAADVDAALHELGWQVITRAEAAARLRAAGYVLDTNRRAGHLLYADDADHTLWRKDFTGYGLEAFAAPIDPPAPADPPGA